MSIRPLGFLWIVSALFACTAVSKSAPPQEVQEVNDRLSRLVASEPATFKMLHQVVARYQGRSFAMTGYLLGRNDGSFRVSASLPMGPKLFDVAKLSGRWETRTYIAETAKVDPVEIGRSVERIYFTDARTAPEFSSGSWIFRGRLDEPDMDALEVWRRPEDLSVTKKRFLRRGKLVLEITYDRPEQMRGQVVARHVLASDARGFTLELVVTGYEPGLEISDDLLQLSP
jgi:hypothetical protein